MADPFEVRLRFTNLLTHLSASTTSSLKTASYALKHRDMDEDLHSCILENLERGSNMNNRANIMYFLAQFCELAMRENHTAYVDMVRRDISKIVAAVAQSGANVKVVRRVVGELKEKGVFDPDAVVKIEAVLKGCEERTGLFLDDDDDAVGIEAGEESGHLPKLGREDSVTKDATADSNRITPRTGRDGKSNGSVKVDKRAIEQRIEEDRERNKRLRESVWAVSGEDEQELEKMWDEGSDLNEDDYIIANEEAEERRQFGRYHRSLLKR